MKHLYAVTIERTIMVMAESEDDAESVAEKHERDEIVNEPELIVTRLVDEIHDIPAPWLDSIPYGGDDDRKCEEIFKSSVTSTCLTTGDKNG